MPYKSLKKKKIVTIGGGTGTFAVLQGLKHYPVKLSAIVTMADSGGSTGRLRDEFGYLPVGDVRMALVALADESYEDNLLRELFLYRFDRGKDGLKGHNFGNLFLLALQDILDSDNQAIQIASRVLRINGTVLPVTNDDVHLVAEYENGKRVVGESEIDEPDETHDTKLKINKLYTEPKAQITEDALEAITNADAIILGPGDLYTSLLANIVIDGVADAIANSSATFIYISNLVTKMGQTYGFTATDHVKEITKYVGRRPDLTVINSGPIPMRLKKLYQSSEGAQIVEDDLPDNDSVLRENVVAMQKFKKPSGDVLTRSLLRHDAEQLAQVLSSAIG